MLPTSSPLRRYTSSIPRASYDTRLTYSRKTLRPKLHSPALLSAPRAQLTKMQTRRGVAKVVVVVTQVRQCREAMDRVDLEEGNRSSGQAEIRRGAGEQ